MNVSIIIPIHKYNEEISSLLSNAVDSIGTQAKIKECPEIYSVFPTSIKKDVTDFMNLMLDKYKDLLQFHLVENDGKTDFQNQVNLGVNNVNSEFFSILEFDDEYSTSYFFNVDKYLKYYDDVDIFMSLMVEVNSNNEALKITNEMVWSQQFIGENGEMGYLNSNALKQNTDFKISGAIINKEEYLNLGGLKSNIKLTFNYEFLLRALNNACKIYTIPKIGYKHLAIREDSLFDYYGKTMPIEERKFWFDTAVKESNFIKNRVIDTTVLNKIVVDEK